MIKTWHVLRIGREILGNKSLFNFGPKKLAFIARLGTFLFFVPLILFLIFFEFKDYLLINILIFIFSGISAKEVNDLLRVKSSSVSSALSFFLGIAPPILTYVHFNIFDLGISIIFYLVITLVFSNWIVNLVFIKEHEIVDFLLQATSMIFILIYPGVLISFIVAITTLPRAPILLLILFSMVSGNDTFAYLIGYFFGKNSYRPTIISPNKTIMGFLGGVLFSVIVAIVVVFLGLINLTYGEAMIFGILIGFFTIIGDLFESGLKRSAGVKDSGNIIPGRGGALDSIDSYLLTGPIFYLCLS
ncbi:phosphatidate cytidylyltransferase [Borrelia miyamotoi]|uniref:Phosphatidate cytidylyltransferase n=1 Tax=Borrelia miyamotoi TaxID=47466 RepID=A0AAQ2WXC7_9SPIR|nr:phosphatidate cytidylyltransferase [Borrelia miyamotoi]AGT27121.1 phosphatidate cytidylyltransferase [Borrelia miyamotoi LB-2001]QTL83282.1 phosphatidate cytidylyltransferase [Borrelia miyamotoi]WAZ85577.1 phosphatidate cytidylyltransferase [Borrelia miyamotoi]WAZ91216.1 phosphatidate cytidylyltransferase [Borrelia miyamotoi]WAZ92648.1 phosphatidate cytidylyltransferase [Borrelia miyamotoi]